MELTKLLRDALAVATTAICKMADAAYHFCDCVRFRIMITSVFVHGTSRDPELSRARDAMKMSLRRIANNNQALLTVNNYLFSGEILPVLNGALSFVWEMLQKVSLLPSRTPSFLLFKMSLLQLTNRLITLNIWFEILIVNIYSIRPHYIDMTAKAKLNPLIYHLPVLSIFPKHNLLNKHSFDKFLLVLWIKHNDFINLNWLIAPFLIPLSLLSYDWWDI